MAELGGAHPCRAEGPPACSKMVGYQFLMCAGHWRMVPYRIKAKVLALWAEVRANGGSLSEEYLTAIKEASDAVSK